MKKKAEKLQAVTDDIRAKLPRLMELEKGCLVRDRETGGLGEVVAFENKFIYVEWKDNRGVSKETSKTLNDYTEIIGKEPMLNDVMEWLNSFGFNRNSEDISINQLGEVAYTSLICINSQKN